MEEEKYVREKLGQQNPFRVPDGYFENLAQSIMSQLPEEKAAVVEMPRRRRWLRPLAAAAACAVVAVAGVTAWQHRSEAQQQEQQTVVAQTPTDDYVDHLADYAMVDNEDIYACLVEE